VSLPIFLKKKPEFAVIRMKKIILILVSVLFLVSCSGDIPFSEEEKGAAGEKLSFSQKDININGHAIECRINAEDSENGFLPSSGTLEKYIPSGGIGVRVDSHSYQNYDIPPYYDSMIAKLIVKGKNREEAIQRMKRALQEFLIEGVDTTIPFHLRVLDNEDFKKGTIYTNFIETHFKDTLNK